MNKIMIRIYLCIFCVISMFFMASVSAYLGKWGNAGLGFFLGIIFLILTIALIAQKQVKKQSHKIFQIIKKSEYPQNSVDFQQKINFFLFILDQLYLRKTKNSLTGTLWFNQDLRPKSRIVDSIISFFMKDPSFKNHEMLNENELLFIENNKDILSKPLIELDSISKSFIEESKALNNQIILMRNKNEPST